MTAPTTTAATPEELAADVVLRHGTEFVAQTDGWYVWRDAIAAAIRQHSEAQRAEIERLTAERDRMREALTVAYDLSTWAACINWRARNKDNQGEWLDELKELITRTQQLVEPLIQQQPAALSAKEATDER